MLGSHRTRSLFRAIAVFLAIAISISGCTAGAGIIYTNVTEPLDLNMNNTPIGSLRGQSDIQKLTEPFTGAQIAVEIYSNAIADAARRSNLKKVYYADLRREEILFGIWQRHTVFVYGE